MIKILLVITLVEGLILWPLQIGNNLDEDIYSTFFVVINFFVLLVVLARDKLPSWLYKIIFIFYSIKIVLLIFMYFNIDAIMNALSIRDVYAFFQPQAIDYMRGNTDVQVYSKIVAYIYIIFGPIMRIPVFYNIIASVLADIFFFKTLVELNIPSRYVKLFTVMFMILPWRNVLSMFMVREAFPTFLVIVSVYFFVRWWRQREGKNFIYAIISSIFSMAFHSGLAALPVVMMLAYILYDPRENKWVFNFKTICKFGIIVLIAGAILIAFGDVILYKFTLAFSSDKGLSEWSNLVINGAESNYLKGFSYTTINDVFLQSPLRMIYFLLSPMPWDWRGVSDLLAFGIDSSVQLLGIWFAFEKMKYVANPYKKIIKVMLCIYILLALVFGAGTFDAGTAMRHRAKFTSILLLIDAMCIAGVKQNKNLLKAARGNNH